jgi:hypothetical protein
LLEFLRKYAESPISQFTFQRSLDGIANFVGTDNIGCQNSIVAIENEVEE